MKKFRTHRRGDTRTAHRLQQVLRHMTGKPCLLCQQRSGVACGVFTPYDPEQYGAPAGKVRLCVYTLCAPCLALPDKTARVEAALLTSVRQH